jgi:hypothetical protein
MTDEQLIKDLNTIRAEMERLNGIIDGFQPMVDSLIQMAARAVRDREQLIATLELLISERPVGDRMVGIAQEALDALNEDRRTH